MFEGTSWIIIAGMLSFIIAAIVGALYNRMVGLSHRVRESWSDLDTELLRRHDLVPRLVQVVRAHAAHERDVFERVTRARARAASRGRSSADREAGERELAAAISQVLAVVEGYPQLKSGAAFVRLQEELVDTEDRIQAARRLYNANVRENNIACSVLPTNLVARLFSLGPAEFFQLESTAVRAVPEVSVMGGANHAGG
jgi:LemA protein